MRWSVFFLLLFILGLNSRLALHAQENETPVQQEAETGQVQQDEQEQPAVQTENASQEDERVTDEATDQESEQAEEVTASEQPVDEEPEADEPEAQEDETAQPQEDAQVTDEATDQEPEQAEEVTASEQPTDEEQEDEATQTDEPAQAEDKPAEEPESTEAEPAEEKPQEEEQEETPTPKIDTVNLQEPKGNWLLKRYWWMESERQYEKIKQIVQEILESRTSFTTMRNDLDRQIFDPFYRTVGISQGELQVTINNLIEQLEAERQAGDLSVDERKLLETVEAEKGTLEELQKKVDSIVSMEDTVDEALNKLYEQINRARSYDKKAWDAFKQIARELSDSKAHELYLSIEAALKNVKGIAEYIKGSYTSYFSNLTQMAKDQVESIKTTVDQLKEKGIDLTKKAKEYEDEDTLAAKKERERKEQEAIDAAIAKRKSKTSLMQRITSFITTPFVWVGKIIAWPFTTVYNLLFGKSKAPSKPVQQQEEPTEEATQMESQTVEPEEESASEEDASKDQEVIPEQEEVASQA